jgi:hypothetical protein
MGALMLTAVLAPLLALSARAQDKPFFEYDAKKTETYFTEKLAPAPPQGAAARELAARMKAVVLELAEKDWGPWLLASMPVVGDSRDGVYFNCPDELLVALAMAYPHLDEEGRAAAAKAARREFAQHMPLNNPWKSFRGEWRGWYDVAGYVARRGNLQPGPWMPGPDRAVARFKTLYGVWAYADTFNRWDDVKALWPDLKALKGEVARSWSFSPVWRKDRPAGPGVLTAEAAAGRLYQHALGFRLYNGTYTYYENPWPEDEADRNVFKQFQHVKALSALLAYGRLARRLDEPAEEAWARERFEFVARQALRLKTAPHYWASPWLVPEVARMLRDHAGAYLDRVEALPSVLVGAAADGFASDGPWYRVYDSHQWFTAHAGSNGACPPGTAMSGFLAQAWLCRAPAEKLDDWTDIPWCQADYWYIQKCAVAIDAYGGAGWTDVQAAAAPRP